MSDVYYIETPETWQDHLRSYAANLMCRWMSRLDFFGRWEALDELRWWMEGELSTLFGFWHEGSQDALLMAVNGEIPLCGIGAWERSQIIDFDDVECSCIECHCTYCTWQAKDDCCPDCGGNLYLGEDWSDVPVYHEWNLPERMPLPQPVLLLTERRAAQVMSTLALSSSGDPIVDAVRLKLRSPDVNDAICASVAFKLAERSRAGQVKYGTKLDRTDLTQLDWLNHAQQDAMDLANYLEVLIQRAAPWSTRFDDMQEQALTMACELQVLIEANTRHISSEEEP